MQVRPRRQDTFDLREQMQPGDARREHHQYEMEHSVMEDSSDAEGEDFGDDSMDIIDHGYGAERNHDLDPDEHESDDAIGDYMSDSSSSLSIPNESIDFDLVYSLTNFAATVEGQASVVKGDSLFLMDDSNSYWWLVRVLKTQEVGYIPAENIETPFERLARLNRHRNVDLASATQAEIESENPALSKSSKNRNRVQIDARDGGDKSNKRGVIFRPQSSIFRYPPAVWNEDDEDADVEWDENDIEIEQALVKDDTGRALDGSEIGDGDIVQIDMQTDVHVEDHAITAQVISERSPLDNVPLSLRPGPADQMNAQGAQPIVQQQSQQPQQAQIAQIQQQQQESQLRSQVSQERPPEEQNNRPMLDPAQATETKRVVITPSVAREEQIDPQAQQQSGRPQQPGPLLPSEIIEKRQQELEQERKRAREEIEAVEEARKRSAKGRGELGLGPPPVQAQGSPTKELTRTPSQETRSSVASSANTGGKLRKERSDRDSEESEKDNGKDKKKKGVFAGLFGRKNKDKSNKASIENLGAAAADARQRGSEDSALSSSQHSHGHSPYPGSSGEGARGSLSPAPGSRAQAQQQQRGSTPTSLSQPQAASPTPGATSPPQQPISTLRERDQQQQALYQQYLKRSPSSPPEQPSYATQAAALVMPTGSLNSSPNSSGYGLGLAPITQPFRTQGGRPGSLLLSPAPGADGQSGFGVPELSVIRVFAGPNLQSDATFKTVLLNSSTTSGDLVRQAMQRFRLAAGENVADYYLTVKQMEGSTLRLRPEEKPLGVFEQLVEEAMEMPKVKRSSVGSISSIASNLSAHPAIKKLPMNDFTDDSAVKFYLNRRGGEEDTNAVSDDGTLSPDTSTAVDSDSSMVEARGRYLSASSSAASSVSPDRFSSPSVRFGLQLVIYKEELPDSMIFDPHTEAIVFKDTLRERSQNSASINPGVPQNLRKKYFNFPKNITVAEVIELGLDRFGILEGVVDGGDEVEDKLTKRRSSTRVRYILTVKVNDQERELPLSSKVVDAFPRPPTFRRSTELRRRSVDSAQLLLGSTEDIQPDDPVFILRRAVAYRPTNTSRHHHRLSAPLDELALSHLHRDSASSDGSAVADERKAQARQPSRQEIIAAQRAASRANQRALLSTQVNAQRGVDVVLPDRAVLRSQRPGGADDDRVRYSYVQPDGETVDVSDIVEAELRASNSGSPGGSSLGDLLSGAVNGAQGTALISRVIDKINSKSGSVTQSSSSGTVQSAVSSMGSTYSEDDTTENAESRTTTPTPTAPNFSSQLYNPVRSMSPSSQASAGRSRSVTPTAGGMSSTSTSSSSVSAHHAYQPSIESMMSMSDISDYRTAASGTPLAMASSRSALQTPSSPIPEPDMPDTKPYKIPKDEFGVGDMLAIIETKAALARPSPPPLPKQMDEVDRLFFGTKIDVEGLHPKIREVYGDSLKRMNDIDAELDNLLRKTLHIF